MISGERKHESKDGPRGYSEFSYGSFTRTLPIPAEIDQEKIEASFKNGLLTVILPKSETEKRKVRQIEVKAG